MKLNFKILITACLFTFLMTSCDQNEPVNTTQTQKETIKKRLLSAAKTATGQSSSTPSTLNEDLAEECIIRFDCFEYVFPITLTNGTVETTVNNDDELYDYYDGLDENADPQINFPITISFENGTQQSIENDEELDNAYESCFGDETSCFSINFPITVISENSSSEVSEKEVNDETELHAYIDDMIDQDEETIITFKYPITITLSDLSVQTIENDEEFDAVYSECYGFEDYDDFEDFECFEVQFPIKALSSGAEITLNSYEDLDDYFDNLDEDKDPEFIFPIDILYTDGTRVTLNSIEDLELAFDNCFYNEDYDDICFDITYPINLVKNTDTESITVDNDEAFDSFLDGLTEEDYFDMTYPVTVILQDESTKTINSDEEFIDLVDSCENDD